MTRKYDRHPLSALCGDMTTDEFIALTDSINVNGVKDPIEIFQGMVLDGWHRYRSATDLGMDCPETKFEGTVDDAKAHVLAKHTRRNWTDSQRAHAVAKIYEWHPGRGIRVEPGSGLKTNTELQELAGGVSEKLIQQAKTVVRNAIPAVQDAVRDGDLSLKKAEQIAKKPKREQAKALAAPKPRPTAAPTPRPVVGASVAALDELKERNAILSEELDRVTDRLAVVSLNATDATDEEKAMAEQLLAERLAEVNTMRAELDAVKASRDGLMTTNKELMQQCALYRNQLVKLGKKD